MMKCWEDARPADKKLFEAISLVCEKSPRLLDFLFDPNKPKLNRTPSELLNMARGFSSSDFLMVRIALDFWSGSGSIGVYELLDAEPGLLAVILQAMARLAAA
jgi:hypothetical protein